MKTRFWIWYLFILFLFWEVLNQKLNNNIFRNQSPTLWNRYFSFISVIPTNAGPKGHQWQSESVANGVRESVSDAKRGCFVQRHTDGHPGDQGRAHSDAGKGGGPPGTGAGQNTAVCCVAGPCAGQERIVSCGTSVQAPSEF